mmetsp:Transcript_52318/g.86934  ORF Transcript_52318/g.86934 Transcript_52318/m.86934 type:complete len:211 (+) Transcript_52318:256-888(+)
MTLAMPPCPSLLVGNRARVQLWQTCSASIQRLFSFWYRLKGSMVQVTDRRGNAASAVVYVIVSSSIPELPATTTPVNDDNSSDSGFLGSTVFWISMGGASLLLFLVVFVIIFCFFSRRAQNIPSHASTSRKSTSLKSSAELKRYEPLEDDRDAGVHVDTSPFNRASLSPGLASNTKDNVQRGTSSIPLPSKPQTGISPPKPPLKPGSIHF